jgi:hypothetical protein
MSLIRFIDDFANKSAANRYVLVSSIGDGRMLANAPSVTRLPEGYVICCPIESRFPRIRAQDLPSEWAISAETDDLYVKDRQIARVEGIGGASPGHGLLNTMLPSPGRSGSTTY